MEWSRCYNVFTTKMPIESTCQLVCLTILLCRVRHQSFTSQKKVLLSLEHNIESCVEVAKEWRNTSSPSDEKCEVDGSLPVDRSRVARGEVSATMERRWATPSWSWLIEKSDRLKTCHFHTTSNFYDFPMNQSYVGSNLLSVATLPTRPFALCKVCDSTWCLDFSVSR